MGPETRAAPATGNTGVARAAGSRQNAPSMTESRIRIRVAPDAMAAFADVTPGPPSEVGELHGALEEAGVCAGIDEVVCRQIGARLADDGFQEQDIQVARGEPGQPGIDGQLELHFRGLMSIGAPREDGSIDYRERFKVYRAMPEDLLARYTPAIKAVQGYNVFATEIDHKDGEDHCPKPGAGVVYDKGEGTLRSTREGMVCYVDQRSIKVLDLYRHEGDVDFRSGNLRVKGSVLVSGEVLDSFEVHAEGDVVIHGPQAGGAIQAGGNVAVAGGIAGDSSEPVEAAGNVTAHHCRRRTVISGTTLRIEDHAIDCILHAAQIRLNNGRGRIIGGETRAQELIELVEAGTAAGAPTHLHAADLSLLKQRQKVAGGPGVTDRHLAWIELELFQVARVRVHGAVHPGVVVHFGAHSYEVLDTLHDVQFSYDRELEKVVFKQL